MTITIDIHCDFIAIPSVIPLDENCPKCACRIGERCIRLAGGATGGCDFGRKGYFSLRKMEERIEGKEA